MIYNAKTVGCQYVGGCRVRLAVYLKALACNIKRMIWALLAERAKAARKPVGEVPVAAMA